MIATDTDTLCQLSPSSFAKLARYITQELGIKMPDSKLPMVQSRLLRRVRELRLSSLDEYVECLLNGSSVEEERVHFIDAITTNKTDFFRESEHFGYLFRVALPQLGQSNRPGANWSIRAWSAGCSSGEEPYTLSMVLSEYVKQQPGTDFSILATDISSRVLERAKTGIYEESQIEPVPDALRKKYFLRGRKKTDRLVRVIPDLRRKISFYRLNFMHEDYCVKDLFDVIFFRNVMIYFDKMTQEAVINKLCRNLVPGGYLFVGHSESLAGLDIPVTPVGTSIFRKHR